jgi:hypothetical protein
MRPPLASLRDKVRAQLTLLLLLAAVLAALLGATPRAALAQAGDEGGVPEAPLPDVPGSNVADSWTRVTPQARAPFPAHVAPATEPPPVMAYYYIWFEERSWNKAKTDYPALGRYRSDDPKVIRQHIRWAKESGIDGFVVSWKSTYRLDYALDQLVEIAEEEDFPLWIIYQGLDYERNPVPVEQVFKDLQYFLERYGQREAFAMYDRPVVIWSGTWEFDAADIRLVTANYPDTLYILASERNTEGYERLAHAVDGNAYYWSSVNPDVDKNHAKRLTEMGNAVRDHGGLWVAPAAPGFDARLIGGRRVVERRNGETLRREFEAALQSSPDVVGLISWNEFSENSHVEPSQRYGTQMLEVLADIRNARPPQPINFDSSAPGWTNSGDFYGVLVLGAVGLFVAVSLVYIARREGGLRNFTRQ